VYDGEHKSKFNLTDKRKEMNIKCILTASALVLSTAMPVMANNNLENVIYVGSGSAKEDSYGNTGGSPATLGYIRQSNAKDFVWGVDVSGEGPMYHNGMPTKSTSFNIMLGNNFHKTEGGRLDAGFLIGMREKSSSCPRSYLGYSCYADTDPSVKYTGNFGGVITWTQNKFMIGARVTGQSKQVILGLRF
jgi:hypothetical protein